MDCSCGEGNDKVDACADEKDFLRRQEFEDRSKEDDKIVPKGYNPAEKTTPANGGQGGN